MTPHSWAAVVTTSALALATLPVAPAKPLAPAIPAPALPAAPVILAEPTPTPSATATPAPVVRCPTAKPATRPPRPSPVPTHDLSLPVIGGAALGNPGLVIPADSPRLPKNLTARSWLVADLETGEVLGACGAHELSAPASVQKLLLAATVMEKLNPALVVKVNAKDLQYEPGSSAVGLVLNGKYTVKILWLGLLLNSGNDAANVLARLGDPKGVPGTVAAMNAKAHELGAWDTHAVTPSGLDGRAQVTSVYDLALIARVCFARADFRGYIATESAKIPAQPPKYKGYQIQNDTQLLYQYEGALGGKTGYTDIARHSFVGVAERDGRRLVVTLLGAENTPAKGWQQGAALLNWGFASTGEAPVGRLVDPGELDRAGIPSATPGGELTGPPPTPGPAPVAQPRTGAITWWPLLIVVAAVLAGLVALGVSGRRRARYGVSR